MPKPAMIARTSPILPILGLFAATQACSSSPGDGDASTTSGTASLTEGTAASSSDGTDTLESSASSVGADATATDVTGSMTTGSVDESSSGEPSATTGGPSCGTVVYVHFDGITLSEGPDDATTNTTGIASLATDLAPYEGNDRAEIVELAAARFVDFDVCFTDERPTEGDYTMAIVTPTNPLGPGLFGLAPTDCGNATPSNIVFLFSEGLDTELMGMSIARSVAISFGLDAHEGDGTELLSTFAASDATLLDECISFGPVSPLCDHDPCRGGDQNSYQELLARLGPASP